MDMRSRHVVTILGCVSIMLGSGAAAMAADVRPDHPRIFLTNEMIPDLKKRCETTHKALFDKVKAGCDKQDKALGPINFALCYLVTGDRKHADFAKEMIRTAKEQPRPGQESIALDWIYDTLTKDEVKEIGAELLKGLWDSDHNHTRCSFRDLVWWNQHYAYTFSETFMKDLFLYGEGVDDAAVKKSAGRGFVDIGDHSMHRPSTLQVTQRGSGDHRAAADVHQAQAAARLAQQHRLLGHRDVGHEATSAAGVALDYTHRLTTDLAAFARGWGQTLNVPGRGWTKDWGAVAGLRWQW